MAADRVFLLEDGMGLEVTKTAARVVGRYPVGRVLVDGKGVGDIGAVVLRDRQLLAQDGLVTVGLVFGPDGTLKAGPEIVSRGFVYVKENEPLLDELRDAIRTALAGREPGILDREALAGLVRVTVRSFINQRFQRKPVVLPVILEA
jgi:ribonuclease J